MILTDTHITSTSCTAQPKWLIIISAAVKVLEFSDFVLKSYCITRVSNLKTAMVYCWDCRLRATFFFFFFLEPLTKFYTSESQEKNSIFFFIKINKYYYAFSQHFMVIQYIMYIIIHLRNNIL